MKKIRTLTAILIGSAAILCLAITSCNKGDRGPEGPAGTNGTNGVSNIQTSTLTTTNANWTYVASSKSYTANITYAAVTSSVVDKGTVQVFMGGPSGTWVALPYSYGIEQILYSYRTGEVWLEYTYSDNTVPPIPSGLTFKIVVIPPGMVKPNVNVHDYSELKQAYGIVD